MKLKNPIIINPFFWFSFIWAILLIVHLFSFTYIYPPLTNGMTLFLLFVIISCLIIGIFFQVIFLNNLEIKGGQKTSHPLLLSVIAILFIASFLYSKDIPLLSTLRGVSTAYREFGIPTITFLAICLDIFFCILTSIDFVYGDNKKKSFFYLSCSYLPIILIYSRGVLIICFLITLLTYFSSIKFKFRHLLLIIILAIGGSIAFNILGNIRMGDGWFDSSKIMQIAQIKEEYAFLSNFSWVISYIDTPLGNLSYNQINILPTYDATGLIAMLLPDFLSKRIFDGYDSSLFLVQPALTVSSFFAGGYKYFGFIGMALSYLEMILIIIISSFICRKNIIGFLAVCAHCSVLSALTFFDNTYTYSGFSFPLIFTIVYVLVLAFKDKFLKQKYYSET